MSTINVSHRELRFTIGRLLYVAGLPAGCVYPVRDCLLDAQSLGLDALAALERSFSTMPASLGRIQSARSGDRLVIDALAQPSYLVAPAVLETIAVESAREPLTVEITNVLEPALLAGLAATDYLYDLTIKLDAPFSCTGQPPLVGQSQPAVENARTAVLIATAHHGRPQDVASPSALGAAAQKLLARGIDLDADLWWRMYELSNDALTPDSDSSRHHAGASLLDQGGKIIGEVGEDDDYLQAAGLPINLAN